MSTVVDLGCGDGGLLKHLLCECAFTPLQRLVGVDNSQRELSAAARRLQGMQSERMTLQPSGTGAMAAVAPAAAAAAVAAAAAPAGAAVEGPGLSSFEGEGSTLSGFGAQSLRGAPSVNAPGSSLRSEGATGGLSEGSEGGRGLSEQLSIIQGTASSFTDFPEISHAAAAGALQRDQQQQQQQQQSTKQGESYAGTESSFGGVSEGGASWAVQLLLLQGDLTSPGLGPAGPGLGSTGPGLGIAGPGLESTGPGRAPAGPGLGLHGPRQWGAQGLQPGCVDLAACIEVLEHLEPQAVDVLGHNVLGGLRPRVAVFTTPNWEYNCVLRTINAGQ